MWNCNSKKSFLFQNNIYIRLSGNPTNNFKFSIANIFSRRFFNGGLFFYIHVNIFKLWVKLKWLTVYPLERGLGNETCVVIGHCTMKFIGCKKWTFERAA